jgi:GGDEF domain-containing protein
MDRSTTAFVAPAAAPRGSTAAIACEPGLTGRIDAAIGRCRQARCPLTLVLVEIDRHEQLVLHAGPAALADLLHSVRIALDDCTSGRARATLVGDATFALVWEDCARSDAVRTVRQMLSQVKTWPFRGGAGWKLSLSAGVATLAFPPRNFPGGQLLDAATRCLSGALLSGGDTLKSIEF